MIYVYIYRKMFSVIRRQQHETFEYCSRNNITTRSDVLRMSYTRLSTRLYSIWLSQSWPPKKGGRSGHNSYIL